MTELQDVAAVFREVYDNLLHFEPRQKHIIDPNFGITGMSMFEKLQKLGEGTYGVVYKVRHKETNRILAAKQMRSGVEPDGVPQSALRELIFLKELSHPNILRLYEVVYQGTELCLVFDFCSMDLRMFLDRIPRSERVHPLLVKSFIFQLMQATCFCHQRRILHRDLKPQNMLITNKGVVKVCDFGLARNTTVPVRPYTHEVVTLWYRAPEIILGEAVYTTGVDTWSIGCIFFELASKKPLFPGDCEVDQLFRIFRTMKTPSPQDFLFLTDTSHYHHKFPEFTEYVLPMKVRAYLEPSGLDLIEKLLTYDPKLRISCKAALKHPYFDDLDKSAMPAGDWDGTLQYSFNPICPAEMSATSWGEGTSASFESTFPGTTSSEE